MNKLILVIKREYFNKVRKKSFIIMTLLMPIIMVSAVTIPLLLSRIKTDKTQYVAVYDATSQYAPLLHNNKEYEFVRLEQNSDIQEYQKKNEYFAYLIIENDLLTNPQAATLYSYKQIPISLQNMIENAIQSKVREQKIASYNIDNLQQIINDSKINYDLRTIKWGDGGVGQQSSSMIVNFVAMFFTALSYMFITMYSAMVMQGVMEEKTNRILEVMVSSVKPLQLMLGKIIGIGLVGITQFLLWIILTFGIMAILGIIFGANEASKLAMEGGITNISTMTSSIELTSQQEMFYKITSMLASINFTKIILSFIAYFIGGFLFFASIYAAIGSAINEQEEATQFMIPMTVIMLIIFYAGIYSVSNPYGPTAVWGSMLPISSPVMMMVRMSYDVSVWEILTSLTILYISAFGVLWVASKIYRVGILMYGKKPSIKEMIKWLRYS